MPKLYRIGKQLDVQNTRHKIEHNINSSYGSGMQFCLMGLDKKTHVLVTPFIDNDNNYIELCVKVSSEGQITVSDFGRGVRYIRKANLQPVPGSGGEAKAINWLKEHVQSEIEVRTDINHIGQDVAQVVRMLQKIYNLPRALKNQDFQTHLSTEVQHKKNEANPMFNKKIAYVLDALGTSYQQDAQIAGRSGHIKKFDFIIGKSRQKLIKTISTADACQAKMLAKLHHSDFQDINLRRKNGCIIFDDQAHPQVYSSLKKNKLVDMLAKAGIRMFCYHVHLFKLKKYFSS